MTPLALDIAIGSIIFLSVLMKSYLQKLIDRQNMTQSEMTAAFDRMMFEPAGLSHLKQFCLLQR